LSEILHISVVGNKSTEKIRSREQVRVIPYEVGLKELARQERYCKAHKIFRYHNSSQEHPLSGRITCATCGCTTMLVGAKRVEEEGRKYWRCSSFLGKRGTEVEGVTFTPKPMTLWSKAPDSRYTRYRAKHRKPPKPRPMLCTDVQIPADQPEKAFVKAWNQLVNHRQRYMASLERMILETDDPLQRYRAKEMLELLGEGQRLSVFDYGLSLKVLDHIEVTFDGRLRVVFLTGVKVTV